MKCIIDRKEVEAKLVENLGYQGGMTAKAVLYKGKEYIVVKRGGQWVQREAWERLRG